MRIHHTEPTAVASLTDALSRRLTAHKDRLVLVCIGSDRSIGDSLGPLVGTLLRDSGTNLSIYGTLESPVHAGNLVETMEAIHEGRGKPFILAIDACLGRAESIGNIVIEDGPLMPGAGIGKNLPKVGDAHAMAIVNVSGFMEYFVLQNTHLGLVMSIAKRITAVILAWEQSTLQVVEAAVAEEAHGRVPA